MEALPGRPVLPELVKQALGGAPVPDRVGDTTELRSALRTAGTPWRRCTGRRCATCPCGPWPTRLDDVEHELDIVAQVWPEVAASVMDCLDARARFPEPVTRVVCHGDFTPSQVLLDGGTPGVVDLDTLCLGDPALDLGRFLAHLHLLSAKVGGDDAAGLVDDLAHDFLRAYGEGSGPAGRRGTDPAVPGHQPGPSALHSCRQLKQGRFDTALSLLRDTHAERISP